MVPPDSPDEPVVCTAAGFRITRGTPIETARIAAKATSATTPLARMGGDYPGGAANGSAADGHPAPGGP